MEATIVKPINWHYIQDIRANDWRRMKGDFGEHIVRELLESQGVHLERLQRRAEGLPDFKISGLPVMIEVKAHMNRNKKAIPSKPPVWQRRGFVSLRRLGWRIFIASPQIAMAGDGGSIICSGIEWYDFQEDGKLDRLEDTQPSFDSSRRTVKPIVLLNYP